MTTNIKYVLIYKTKFFETFLNDLQTLCEEYQKRLKRVGVLGVNECMNGREANMVRWPLMGPFFELQQHNVPQKITFFMKIYDSENENIV